MVEQQILISQFLEGTSKDPRIGSTHISVFIALTHYWSLHGCINPFRVFSYDIMPIAKIASRATYLKCVSDLNECGYLHYQASRNRNAASRIRLPINTE